ncbi:tripartite tricarboxylate transporter TctB family protein [Pseudomonas sp. B11D7D]|nr:tripartite tricarboxylate transporter TctB family protein [Pseudomonas sp. B11D7D]QNH05078.1 tripartite tricarboxylate transporter TctB family protein [Pseudomonas sp. B11D7D]
MKYLHLDAVIGLCMLLFCFFFYSLEAEMPKDPALFPRLILVALGAFSLFILGGGLIKSLHARNRGEAVTRFFVEGLRGPLTIYAGVVAYVALIPVLGFFAATSLATAFFMMYFGYRSYVKALMVLLSINAFIYLLFVWQLKIFLPTGLLV